MSADNRLFVHELGHLLIYALVETFNQREVYSVVFDKISHDDPDAGTRLCQMHESLLLSKCSNYDFLVFDMLFSLGGIIAERHILGTAKGGYSDYQRWKQTLQISIGQNKHLQDEDISNNYEKHSKFLLEYFLEINFKCVFTDIITCFQKRKKIMFSELKLEFDSNRVCALLDRHFDQRLNFQCDKKLNIF